jgi:hypothetical protein
MLGLTEIIAMNNKAVEEAKRRRVEELSNQTRELEVWQILALLNERITSEIGDFHE